MVTAPIIPMILYIIGYNLEFSTRILQPAAKLVAVRLLFFAGILGLLYLLFPAAMADPAFAAAAWLYFMGPVGFGVIGGVAVLHGTGGVRGHCADQPADVFGKRPVILLRGDFPEHDRHTDCLHCAGHGDGLNRPRCRAAVQR